MVNFEYLGNSEQTDHLWDIFCLIVGFGGLGVRMLTIGQVPKGTSGRNTENQVADVLNTKGIYSVVRHPLYLGNFFMWLGVALMAHNFWLTLVYFLVFWLYYERIMFAEEEYLRGKFGDEFLKWARKTPPFVPKLNQYNQADLEFSWRNVLRREYNGFFALVLLMFVFELVGEFRVKKVIFTDVWWLALMGVGLVVWLVLRTLKKQTAILDTEGR